MIPKTLLYRLRPFTCLVVIMTFLVPFSSHATELSDALRINGFLTFGGSTVDQEGIVYRSYSDQSGGATKHRVDWETNSLIGLQAEYDFSPQFSATLQGVSRKNDEGNFAPSLEWAYLTYRTQQDIDIRLGLLHVPLYRNTELDYINYTRIWAINPFISQYTRGFSQFKGVDVLYYTYFNDFEITLQGSYGYDKPDQSNTDFIQQYESNDIKVISLEIEKGLSRFKISHFHAHIDYTEGKKLQPAETTPPPGSTPNTPNQSMSATILQQITSLDLEIPLDGLTLSGGMSFGSSDDLFPSTRSHYLSLAYPFEKLTPYAIHTEDLVYFDSNEEHRERTFSTGMRYDFYSGMALKGQIDRVYPDQSGFGRGDGTSLDDFYHIYTVVIDMVF